MGMKTLPKAVLILAVVSAVGYGINWGMNSGYFKKQATIATSVPDKIDLPGSVAQSGSPSGGTVMPVMNTSKEVVRGKILPWNGNAGLAYAVGGADTAPGSLMAKYGVTMNLKREEDYSKMTADLVAFAENPKNGVQFVTIMGDGFGPFVAGTNEAMKPFGQSVEAIALVGFSRGEDKCIIDKNANVRGSLIAGVLGDGDLNICIKYAADNGIPINSDPKIYDPNAMNFTGVASFIEADTKFINGACEMREKIDGSKIKVCVNGSGTWTPGDVNVAQKRGNIRVLASTKEYAWQMPTLFIGNKQWMEKNPETVKAILAAAFEGGELVRSNDAALLKAGEAQAKIYGEQDAAYWAKYFKGVVEPDKTGNMISLGGSTTGSLADNAFYFGLNGNDNLYKKVYTVYSNIAMKYFPSTTPFGIKPYDTVVNTKYLQSMLASAKNIAPADKPTFGGKTTDVFAEKNYSIEFETGKATFTPAAIVVLNDLLDQASITNLNVTIAGHTDNVGNPASNVALSKARAEAVKNFLMENAPSNFPAERVVTRGYGDSQPIASNATVEGRAKNRRVQIILKK